jgi:GNAT superfamily N-acetyltransferase
LITYISLRKERFQPEMNLFYEKILRPEPVQVEQLRTPLKAFNESQLGNYDAETILVTARSEQGELHGAVYGWLQFGWLYIDLLWVDEAQRRQGIGRALLQKIEAHADAHGIRRSRLATADFQSGYALYQRCAYAVYAEVPIMPDASGVDMHVEYLMWKHWTSR